MGMSLTRPLAGDDDERMSLNDIDPGTLRLQRMLSLRSIGNFVASNVLPILILYACLVATLVLQTTVLDLLLDEDQAIKGLIVSLDDAASQDGKDQSEDDRKDQSEDDLDLSSIAWALGEFLLRTLGFLCLSIAVPILVAPVNSFFIVAFLIKVNGEANSPGRIVQLARSLTVPYALTSLMYYYCMLFFLWYGLGNAWFSWSLVTSIVVLDPVTRDMLKIDHEQRADGSGLEHVTWRKKLRRIFDRSKQLTSENWGLAVSTNVGTTFVSWTLSIGVQLLLDKKFGLEENICIVIAYPIGSTLEVCAAYLLYQKLAQSA